MCRRKNVATATSACLVSWLICPDFVCFRSLFVRHHVLPNTHADAGHVKSALVIRPDI